MVIGVPLKVLIKVTNKKTRNPVVAELATDVDLILYSESNNQAIGKFGTGEGLTAVEHPSPGIFIIPISKEMASQLVENSIAWIEGTILPCNKPVKISLGKTIKIRTNG